MRGNRKLGGGGAEKPGGSFFFGGCFYITYCTVIPERKKEEGRGGRILDIYLSFFIYLQYLINGVKVMVCF